MRLGQALEVGAQIVATACPWCHIMLEESVKDMKAEGKIRVKDVAELMAECLDL